MVQTMAATHVHKNMCFTRTYTTTSTLSTFVMSLPRCKTFLNSYHATGHHIAKTNITLCSRDNNVHVHKVWQGMMLLQMSFVQVREYGMPTKSVNLLLSGKVAQ
jgi:hypothetical protein